MVREGKILGRIVSKNEILIEVMGVNPRECMIKTTNIYNNQLIRGQQRHQKNSKSENLMEAMGVRKYMLNNFDIEKILANDRIEKILEKDLTWEEK